MNLNLLDKISSKEYINELKCVPLMDTKTFENKEFERKLINYF